MILKVLVIKNFGFLKMWLQNSKKNQFHNTLIYAFWYGLIFKHQSIVFSRFMRI